MEFKKGDYVQIRSFADMVQEFGTDRGGDIPCRCSFNRDMEHLCGVVAKVVDIIQGIGVRGAVLKLEFPDGTQGTGWSYSTDMVKQING